MKVKGLWIGVILGIIIGVLIVYRLIVIAPYPKLINDRTDQERRYAESQNSEFMALAGTYEDLDFWGNRSYFYMFEFFREELDHPIRTIRLYPSKNDPIIDFSETGHFSWADDSLGVEVGFFGVELRMQAIEP